MNKLIQDIKNNKPIIIFADTDYFPLLMKYKDKNANIKLISCHKAVSMVSFEITEAMIGALLKKEVEYTKAKQILNNLQLLGDKRIKDAPDSLKKYYDVIKPLIKDHGYDASHIFKGKSLYLFNATNDVQFAKLFESKGFKLEHLSIEELGINQEINKVDEVINFDNKMEQYMYVFADIRTKLIQNPDLSDKIRIVVNDDYDLFYLNYFANIFHLEIYANLTQPLYKQPSVLKVLRRFYETKTIDSHYIKDTDPASKELARIIDVYEFDRYGDFEKAYLNLVEITNAIKYTDNHLEKKGIIATNEYVFNDEFITYVLSFQDDIFYHSSKDTDIITDVEKKQIGINPSYVLTLINKQKMKSFVQFNNIVLLSRVKQHLDEHIYDSGLIEELKLSQKNFCFVKQDKQGSTYVSDEAKELFNMTYTDEATFTLASILKDKNFDTSEYKEVECYNNQPIGLNVKPKDAYSITDIQDYNKCPFKYLLEHELKLSSIDDKYFANLGILIHGVLEHIDDPENKFDELYKKGVEEFNENMLKTSNGEYDINKYNIFVEIAKPWFKRLFDEYRARLKQLPNVSLHKEVEMTEFRIPESEFSFKGTIDVLALSKTGDKTFYTIIDYKTGNDKFIPQAVCVGQNIQLPMYFDGIRHSNQAKLVSNAIGGGFGLKKALANSPKKFANETHYLTDKTLNDFIRAKLIGLSDQEYKKSLFIYGKTKNNKPTTTGIDQMVSINGRGGQPTIELIGEKYHYTVDDLVKHAHAIAIETIEKMRKSEYWVTVTADPEHVVSDPYSIEKKKTNCKYCMFADVCYKNSKTDYHDQTEHILDVWKNLKKGDEDDK